MKITIEPTDQLVTIVCPIPGGEIPAPLWVGQTDKGIPVQALITRIAAEAFLDLSAFNHALQETKAPTPEPIAYPLRLIL